MRGKKVREALAQVDREKLYTLEEAVGVLGKLPRRRFAESVDVAIQLGVDSRRSDQNVRGAAVLPAGTGRQVRVAVFAEGDAADAAKEAGADLVGSDELIDKVKGGKIDFDVAIAHPDTMRAVAALGPVLGPRGLMPNPRTGTVSADVARAVTEAKSGRFEFRNDKAGIVHGSIGRADFSAEQLRQNLEAVLGALHKAKPADAKGVYLRKVSISTTMGPGLRLDPSKLEEV